MVTRVEFFDTNVLVAASLSRHEHHSNSLSRLASIPSGFGACAAHTLAETYNTLTKDKRGYRVPPTDAAGIIQLVRNTYTLVSLTPEETLQAIESAASRALCGPIIYDALLLACARKIDATIIYTWNLKHFHQIAPDLAPRIVEP